MTRFEEDPSILRLPAETREEHADDSLLERWLARPKVSRPRMRAAPPHAATTTEVAPLGDELADAWFK